MATTERTDSPARPPKVNSEILDRLPPHNLDAERGVLGSVMLDPNLCDEVVMILRPDDFYADAHRRLYQQIVAMHDEGKRIDVTLIVERLTQAGELEAVGGMAYVVEVIQSVAVAAHAVYYADIVHNKAVLRSLIHASTSILRDAYDPTLDSRELINQAEERIFAIRDSRSSNQVVPLNEVLLDAFEQIDRRLEGGTGGIPTGFTDLDNMTGGLHEGELVILAARPSMGKTAFATNIADYVSVKSGMPTLFVSLEMARLELAQRMLCARGKINGKKFRGGFLSAEDRAKLVEASTALSKAALYIDDTPSRTVTEIAAAARRLKRKVGLGMIVIDYLQLIEPENSRDPRQEQVAKIARRLKGMARELSAPVLCLAQLNRQADGDSRPKLSHLRESGAIEQDADVVMFVHREEYGMSKEDAQAADVAGKADILLVKQRNGPTGDVHLVWRQEYTCFENQAVHPHDDFEAYDGGGF